MLSCPARMVVIGGVSEASWLVCCSVYGASSDSGCSGFAIGMLATLGCVSYYLFYD